MQELPRHEIDPPSAEELRKLPLQLEDSEAQDRPGLEIDQEVDIAVGPKIIPQRRAEDRKLTDSPPPAELCQALGIDIRSQTVQGFTHEKSVTQMP